MRRLWRYFGGGIVAAIVVFGTLASAGSGAGPACDLTQLQLRDSTVNQGLGSYDRLVRGKETLVRMYFSLPSCASTSSSIQITGGTLSATGAGGTLTSGIAGTPTPVTTYPSTATYAAAPVKDIPADIKFVVPGSALAPGSTTNAYTASFSAMINFQYKTSATGAVTPSSRSFSSFASKPIEKKTNALRILVVPMGNASNPYSTEFPAEAVSAVENGIQTLSRIYPVPDGVSTLGANSGGIRYAIDSTLLNVATPFCGNGVNFDAIKSELAQFLLSWNKENLTKQADRVVGAVWSGNSLGSASNCAEGMASVISPEAWVRAFPDSVSSPSMTGALFAMEISHTFGLVPAARSFGGFHSLNAAADGTAPNRGYNVTTRSFLADDRTAMNLGGTWNNNTTILEKEDYAYLLCALGGQTNTECTTSNVAGTVGGVAAFSGAYSASGTTDGTPAGTEVEESYAASDLVGLGTNNTSDYKLVQRSASNAILQTNGVRVSFNESHHDASPGTETRSKGTFAFVLSRNISATKFELWKGAVGTGTLLWSTQKTNPPTITSFTATAAGAQNYTKTSPADDTQPAMTDDAAWVAWNRAGDVRIGPATDSDKAVTAPKPPLVGVSGGIIFERGGDIYTMPTPDPGENPQLLASNGSQPVWSPDGSEIAFTRGGDLWVMNAGGTNQRQLTNTAAQERTPAYGPDGRIAFVRDNGTGSAIWVMNGDGTGQTQLTATAVGGEHPAWSPDGQLIAFDSGLLGSGQSGIYTMAPDGSNQTRVPNTVDGDLAPAWSPTGDRLAFYNSELDLFVMGAGGSNRTQVTSTTGVGEFNPSWSGDGTRLVFFSGPLSAPLTLSGPTNLEIINVAGDGRLQLTDDNLNDHYPNWQMIRPNATAPALIGSGASAKLAFLTGGDIYTIPVDLSGATPKFDLAGLKDVYRTTYPCGEFTCSQPEASHPSWGPGATRIAFGANFNINVVDVASGQVTALTETGNDTDPSWSRTPGTNLIAFTRDGPYGDEIRTVDPSTQGVALLTDGSSPSYGTDGRIALSRPDGNIYVWKPGIEFGSVSKAFDNGFQPALVGNTFAFVRNFVLPGTEFFENDIMLGRPGSGVAINAQVTDDNPGDDRLDLLVVCPDRTYIGAVALKPDDASGTSASWQANYDPSLTCANPTLKLAVSDGFNRVVTGTGQDVQAEQKSPTAAIYAPSPGQTFLQYQLIPARGSGWDPEDGTLPAGRLQWKLEGPSGFSATGGGPFVDFSAPAGGFPLGSYTLTLTVMDSAGNSDTATRSLSVIGDADNDGMSTAEEGQSCITFNSADYPSADQDPMNAFRDDDNDGLVNVADPAPCVAASEYEASIVFDPSSMQLGSQGTVTANITVPNRQVTDISDAYVKSINNIDVSTNAALRAKQLLVVRGTNTAQAKIDRTPLSAFFVAHNIRAGQRVRIVIAGSSANGSWTFEGSGTLGVN
jgi:Tol biopolymer transport system component